MVLGLVALEHLLLVIACGGRLQGLDHAQQPVDEGVVKPVVLVGDEGDGMEVPIDLGASAQLEHLGSQHPAGVVANTGGPEIEGLEHRRDLVV
jgi:hypothetical protein